MKNKNIIDICSFDVFVGTLHICFNILRQTTILFFEYLILMGNSSLTYRKTFRCECKT